MQDNNRVENLSVLMPARNEESTIDKSVNSVLRQLRPGDELLVYDDFSIDETSLILQQIDNPSLRVITGKRQIGTSAAANLLNHEASHSLVAKLDADDFSLPGRFNYQRDVMAKGELDFHFGCSLLRRGRVLLPQPPRTMTDHQIRAVLPFDNPLTNSTMISRKETIADLGGYPEGAQQDYSLWLRAALAGAKMKRDSRYLVLREIPVEKIKSEARNKPVADQIKQERLDLYRHLVSIGELSGDINAGDVDNWMQISSKETHKLGVMAKISKLFS